MNLALLGVRHLHVRGCLNPIAGRDDLDCLVVWDRRPEVGAQVASVAMSCAAYEPSATGRRVAVKPAV